MPNDDAGAEDRSSSQSPQDGRQPQSKFLVILGLIILLTMTVLASVGIFVNSPLDKVDNPAKVDTLGGSTPGDSVANPVGGNAGTVPPTQSDRK